MEEKIKQLLLSWDEYNEKDFSVPYVFSIEKDNQELVYFGARHCYDPQDEEFDSIEKYWDQIIQKHSPEKITAVVEGGIMRDTTERNAAILKAGESAFTTHLARKSNIEVLCFEPIHGKVLDALTQKYSKEELFYHDVAQIALQWNKLLEKVPFNEYIQKYIERDKKETDWTDFDFSYNNIQKIHKDIFKTEFDETDKNFFYHIGNPAENTSIMNEISREGDVFRDVAIVKGIIGEWQKGKSTLVVYGSAHAVIQEYAVREFLK